MKRPPALATALLNGLGPEHQPAVGDLVEQYARRQSRRGYWRQTLALLLTVSLRNLGRHPWIAMRAVVVGWATLLLFFAAIEQAGLVDGVARAICLGQACGVRHLRLVAVPDRCMVLFVRGVCDRRRSRRPR